MPSMLCLCTLSVAGWNPGVRAAEPTRWNVLDAELAALERSLPDEEAGPRLHGFLRANYAASPDLFIDLNGNGSQDPGENDLGGFSLDQARVGVSGAVGDYRYELSFDFGGLTPDGTLIDAYVATRLGEAVRLTLGQFRTPFLRSGLVSETDTLMIARTRNGIFYSVRSLGVLVEGDWKRLHWSVADQNGVDGTGSDALLTARVEVALLGSGAGLVEGAYGAGDDARLTIGGAVSDDAGLANGGTAAAVDAAFAQGRFSFQAELVDYDDGYTSTQLFPGEPRGGTTPYSLTGSWMVVRDTWEAALRYEDLDEDVLEREVWTAGVNRYVQGHDLKWQLDYAYAPQVGQDVRTIALGLTVAF